MNIQEDKIPNISRELLKKLNIQDLTDEYDSEEDSDESTDQEDQEPLIIQLMESMFTRKKTVVESEAMINQISIEEIAAELRQLRMQE